MKQETRPLTLRRLTGGLLVLFLLSLATLLFLHWRVSALEAEQAALRAQVNAFLTGEAVEHVDEAILRLNDLTQPLRRLSIWRTRMLATTGADGFALLCALIEGIRRKIYGGI